MARRTTSDENKLLRILGQMPFDPEKVQEWTSIISENGLTEEVAHEIQAAVADLEPIQDEEELTRRARNAGEINLIVRRWRLSQNLPGRHGR